MTWPQAEHFFCFLPKNVVIPWSKIAASTTETYDRTPAVGYDAIDLWKQRGETRKNGMPLWIAMPPFPKRQNVSLIFFA
ncbi:MAG: hypothetical protein D6820_01920 [Lentisphaerae bacterium]|nr:MAG: hypothetical protein D6820_01920 [Lentisphaerota bacterium]